MLVRLLPLTGAMFGGASLCSGGFNASFPLTSLADPQPKVVFQTLPYSAGANDAMVEIDLGAVTTFDTLAVLYTNMSSLGQWSVYGSAAAFGAAFGEAAGLRILGSAAYGAFGITPSATRRRRHAMLTGAAVNVRYIRVYLRDFLANNPEQLIRVGNIVMGNNALPTSAFDKNFELGSGRRVQDLSEVEQLPGGELNRIRRAKVPGFKATWSNLTNAEARTLYATLEEIGLSEPTLLIEDPDATAGQNERIHYGVLKSVDVLERVQDDKQSVTLEVVDWL